MSVNRNTAKDMDIKLHFSEDKLQGEIKIHTTVSLFKQERKFLIMLITIILYM